MIARRDVIIGGACGASALVANFLTPRQRMTPLPVGRLRSIIPQAFAGWRAQPSMMVSAPDSDGALAARLYNDRLNVSYLDESGTLVSLFIAYGSSQTNALQVHRPEECYPAFGYDLSPSFSATASLGHQAVLPLMQLTATMNEHREHISYFVRIGDRLPSSPGAQRQAILHYAFAGVIADGVLVRCSNTTRDAAAAFVISQRFLAALLHAVVPQDRLALIGPSLAAALR